MKASELKGRAVVSLAEPEKIGTVDTVILDVATSRVAGFTVRTGALGGAKPLLIGDVREIGADALTIANRAVLDAEERLAASDVKGLPTLDDLVGCKVISVHGVLLGTLGDLELDAAGQAVTCYVMGGSLWEHLRHEERTFAPAPGLRFGEHLLIVPDAVAADLGTRGGQAVPPPPAAEPNP